MEPQRRRDLTVRRRRVGAGAETLLAAALALAVASPLAAQARGARDPWREFDAYVAQAVRDWSVPGLAIAVVKDDSLVFVHAYGVRTLGGTDSVTPHTLFANASTTKAFTSMVVAMLVDSGTLRFDDRVSRLVPELVMREPYVTQELTLRDLLSHRVGFGDPEYLWYGRDDDFTTMARHLSLVPPQSSFRSRYAYNNVTYATAGVMAARATGATWDDLVRTRILGPLGMSETVTQGSGLADRSDVAQPHDLEDDTLRTITRDAIGLVDAIAPAGAMYSNVLDMAKWMRFLLDSGRAQGRRLVSAASFAELFRPQTVIRVEDFYPTARLTRPHFTAYGMGWFLQDYRGEAVAMHTGSIDGTVAIVGLIPDRRLGVVVFANRDHAEVRHALMLRVFDQFIGGARRDWSTDLRALYDSLTAAARARLRRVEASRVMGTQPSLPLERYAGTYTDSLFGDLTVRLENGGLVASASAFLTADLEPWNYDTFRLRWRQRWLGTSFATFRLGANGQVAEVAVDGAVRRRVERRGP